MTDNYEDIINMPYPPSSHKPAISLHQRAAQFAPFAALNGHDDAIRETARFTSDKATRDESYAEALDMKIETLRLHMKEQPEVKLLHFVADRRKAGGQYVETQCHIKEIDEVRNQIILSDNSRIAIDDIYDIIIKESPSP
jgi:hypothetical protein